MNNVMDELIRDLSGLPVHAIAVTANWWVRNKFTEFAILETGDGHFDIDTFAYYGHCDLKLCKEITPHIETSWSADLHVAQTETHHAFFDIEWREHKIQMLRMTWKESHCNNQVQWLIGDNDAILNQFFAFVCKWNPPYEPVVEVFQDGYWQRSRTLHQAIQSSTLDNLIVSPGLKEELQADLAHFFASKDVYDKYSIPWKRGVLLSGPPGNGKTHAVKSLINWLGKPALYVKSLKSRHYTEHAMMHSVFSRARTVTPCVLVFEDLESIVTAQNRSYFLNELDGFALNTGILVLATTNHPELLDPAITERPSRFDRKYNFGLPSQPERERYLAAWNEKIEAELKLTDKGQTTIAAETEGFSFAFMKELIMASMMRWINQPEKPAMDDVMAAQTLVLRSQMANALIPSSEILTDDEDFDEYDE
jgi:hypothetical protein